MNHVVDLSSNNVSSIRLPDEYFTEFTTLIHYSELIGGDWIQKKLSYQRSHRAVPQHWVDW
ncbi:MAG: hypothetical protein PHF53_08900 [Bacteroidales bacterium]|nr:hypothetical protein [Bacteroidales bacterium]MDD3872595.1 hypothetical protein [Bacteroidales bacterium]